VKEEAVRASEVAPEPGAATLLGVKLEVMPEGDPLSENATAELNPPIPRVVKVTALLPPGDRVSALDVPDSVKPGTLTMAVAV
jgi:hypothetical protein